jgi:hypothetical protein
MADLSPAAQAIVAAFDDRYELCPLEDNWQEVCIAAALRAAADQVVPHTAARTDRAANRRKVRSELLAIATELEAQ